MLRLDRLQNRLHRLEQTSGPLRRMTLVDVAKIAYEWRRAHPEEAARQDAWRRSLPEEERQKLLQRAKEALLGYSSVKMPDHSEPI